MAAVGKLPVGADFATSTETALLSQTLTARNRSTWRYLNDVATANGGDWHRIEIAPRSLAYVDFVWTQWDLLLPVYGNRK